MNKIQSGVCKGKIWVIPEQEKTAADSRFVMANQDKIISPLDLNWCEDKISCAKEVAELLSECNLIPNPCFEFQATRESKYWTVSKNKLGKGAFGVDFRPEWTLEGDHTAYLHGFSDPESSISISTFIPVVDGNIPYRFSGFFGTHRAAGIVEVYPINQQGQKSTPIQYLVPESSKFKGGTKLSDYAYYQWSFDLPGDTTQVEIVLKLGDFAGQNPSINSSFLFFTNLYFGVLGNFASAYVPHSQNAFELSTYLSHANENIILGTASLPPAAVNQEEITLAIENSDLAAIQLSSRENTLGTLTVNHEAVDQIIALDHNRAIAIVRWSQSGKLNILDNNNRTISARFGQISPLNHLSDELFNGENLLLNSDFAQDFQGWEKIKEARLNFSNSTRLQNSNCAYLHTQANKEKGKLRIYSKDAIMPLNLLEQRSYVLSGYFGYHRCTGCIGLEWLDKDNRIISSISLVPECLESRGGRELKDYDLQRKSVICPIGAKKVTIYIEKSITAPGKKDSFLFFTRLFFGLENPQRETLWQPAKKYLNNSAIQKSLQQEGFWSQDILVDAGVVDFQQSNRVSSLDDEPKTWKIINCYMDKAEKQANNFLLLEGAIAAGAGQETLELYQQFKSSAKLNVESSLQNTSDLLTGNIATESIIYPRHQQRILDSNLWLKDWYLEQYPDAQNLKNPLEHFLDQNRSQNFLPNPYFDPKYYQQQNGVAKSVNPILDYLTSGWRDGKDPSPRFSVNNYLAENPELLRNGQEPLDHLLCKGVRGFENVPAYDLDNPNYYVIPHKTKGSKVVQDSALRGMIDFERLPLAPKQQDYQPKCLNLHWIIPDFHKGAGGHMTIFRIIRFLELFGHQQTIWINNPRPWRTGEEAFTSIIKDFLPLRAQVKYIDYPQANSLQHNEAKSEFAQAEGDIAIATDWGSVYPTLAMSKFKTRFYFVQDYEPMFYPMGSHYLAAEATYKEDLNCICASQWLQSLMSNKHERWARNFWLAPDSTFYYPPSDQKTFNKNRLRIALYARTFTSRRAVELAILALEVLARQGVDIHVDFFGEPLNFTQAPFTCSFHGILPLKKLGKLYRECDLGMVFSATNYSLVPQEMMACGLPVIDLDVESTNLTYEPGVVTLAKPLPRSIADALIYLAENDEVRQKQITKALDWVSNFSWHDSAKLVEKAFLDRLEELSYQPQQENSNLTTHIKVTVVIPTYNGGALFKQVLQRLSTQCLPWEYEVLIIDSGSNDGTIEAVQQLPQFKLHCIDKKDFGHGKTRNLGAAMAQGEYVAFLTQDALPVHDTWLYDVIVLLECYPHVAGVFGRHIAYPYASEFTKRDLHNHFAKYDNLPLVFNKQLKANDYGLDDAGLQRILHFYSDNNSCFRKTIWEEFPYPDVVYGEDQLWAKHIINRGYSTAYAKNAVVYHSHDYDERETFERSRVEAHFFNQYFGYEMINRGACSTEFVLNRLSHHDIEWGKANNLSNEEILQKCSLNVAGIAGYMQGKRDFDLAKEIRMWLKH